MKKNKTAIQDYIEIVKKTDRLPTEDLTPVLHGLFGEVGGIMVAAKKLKREPGSFTGFDNVIVEEFGDVFWYLCCLSIRLGINIEDVFHKLASQVQGNKSMHIGSGHSIISISYEHKAKESIDSVLISLGKLTGNFLSTKYILEDPFEKVYIFLKTYLDALILFKVGFGIVIETNIRKISSRFIRPKNTELPNFDLEYPEFEQLPQKFEIEFVKRSRNQQAMRWNGVFIGDPLSDSIKCDDDYKFHDVFHFSYVSILHWSPTFRALIKHKRKSKPEVDEAQDGGRAIVVEEGLTAWIFNIAKENNLFEDNNSLTFDMLKNIEQFVKGFEVEQCPLILWEEAILKGYEVFRSVLRNGGGVVVGNRHARTLEYKKK